LSDLSEILQIRTTEQIDQERVISIEVYKTLPILWTSKIKRLKYKVSNKAESTVINSQSSKFRLYSWCTKCPPYCTN